MPVERDAAIQIARPILNNVIGFFAKGSEKVFEVVVANILYPEVIHAQVEPDGTGDVLPEAGRVRLLEISMAGEALAEEFVGKNAGLWEAVHSPAYFHVGITI